IGLSTYDATYLLLARTMGVPLVTFDEQLAAAWRRLSSFRTS
ncbi:MAG: PIN domain-containing protein, partial [Deltaproteobacteria bacterium]